MKIRYLIIIIILILAAVSFEILLFYSPLGQHSRLEKAIQSVGIFVALLAAVIALSSADTKKKKVEVIIAQPYIEEEKTYERERMIDELNIWYKHFPTPIRSHQVHFKITNKSDLTLTRPTLTFRIPVDKKHPNKFPKEKTWSRRSFNSNLYNSTQELRIFEFADTSILSNSNLPYWNSEEEITIWIRMVLDDGKLEPFDVEVSVNCENAEGFTKRIKINPKDLLNAVDTTRTTSAGLNDQIQGEKDEQT